MSPGDGCVGRQSELELFEALRSRADSADLADFADRLRRCVWWVLNRMNGGRDLYGDVEDIVGDVHVRLEQLRGRGFTGGAREFRSYLYKVVVSACVEARRCRRWTQALDAPLTLPDGEEKPLGEVVADMVDSQLTAAERIEETEERQTLGRAIERLDPRCRDLIEQFHLREVPIRELARRHGARANTIEVALTRCRGRLYAAFLHVWVSGSDHERRERIEKAAGRLGGRLGDVFRAWWTENRSVAQISKAEGIDPDETRRILGKAKTEVWRLVGEGVEP